MHAVRRRVFAIYHSIDLSQKGERIIPGKVGDRVASFNILLFYYLY